MKFQATIDVELTDDDFETIIDMAGYGIDGWSRWAEHDDEKHTYTVHFWEDPDVESPMKSVTLSYRQIGEALVKLASNPGRYNVGTGSVLGEYLLGWLRSQDAADIDSDVADAVIQVAIFNTVQYS